jgi:hypothetical protein
MNAFYQCCHNFESVNEQLVQVKSKEFFYEFQMLRRAISHACRRHAGER